MINLEYTRHHFLADVCELDIEQYVMHECKIYMYKNTYKDPENIAGNSEIPHVPVPMCLSVPHFIILSSSSGSSYSEICVNDFVAFPYSLTTCICITKQYILV